MSPVVSDNLTDTKKDDEMAAKEYKVNTPAGTVTMWANSAEQAARRAEREFGTGHSVTQRSYVSNRTRNMTNVKGYEEDSESEDGLETAVKSGFFKGCKVVA